ncbi:hypothetical protein SDC9_42263 [bioreactor metagenome]|jgi:uncharacterized protein YqgC (DUF456 family)|uniref:DUF456 domain-containing protein n=1 Tax=bioreactor metagenome TaxID=1076179 RepID=A0A644VXI8_9ZZZZ|nr:DUF456 domain-containing protein [Paludibacter sp.]
MDLLLIIIAGLFLLTGFLGSVLPILPGIPLSYLGLILLHLTSTVQFSSRFLIVLGIVVIIVQLLDFIIPVWGTKKTGGSKAGVRGSLIGLFAGFFMGPWGIITGPFVGALLGELLVGKTSQKAIKAALGTFLGLLTGTILKLVLAGIMIYYYVEALVRI